MVKYKKHLRLQGLVNIVSIKTSINLGLPHDLSRAFPKIIPTVRPLFLNFYFNKKNLKKTNFFILIKKNKIIDPNWISGFVSGEGNYFINVINSKTKVGKQVVLMFSITEQSRGACLLRSFCDLLGCGAYYPRSNRDEGNFTKFSDIEEKFIPLFLKLLN